MSINYSELSCIAGDQATLDDANAYTDAAVHILENADTAEAARVDALIQSGMWLFADQGSFPAPVADNHGRVVHSHADGAMFYSHAGSWNQLASQADLVDTVAALELADSVLSDSLTDSVAALEALNAGFDSRIVVLENEKADEDSVRAILLELDSVVGNYQGGATISDDLVSLIEYNDTQDDNLVQLTTVVNNLDDRVDDVVAGNIPFTGFVSGVGFGGLILGQLGYDAAGNVDDNQAAVTTLAASGAATFASYC